MNGPPPPKRSRLSAVGDLHVAPIQSPSFGITERSSSSHQMSSLFQQRELNENDAPVGEADNHEVSVEESTEKRNSENAAPAGEAENHESSVAEPMEKRNSLHKLFFDKKQNPGKKLEQLFSRLQIQFQCNQKIKLDNIQLDAESDLYDRKHAIKLYQKFKNGEEILHKNVLILYCDDEYDENTSFGIIEGIHRISALKAYQNFLVKNNQQPLPNELVVDYICFSPVKEEEKLLIRAFSQQSIRRELSEKQLLKQARCILKHFPDLLNMGLPRNKNLTKKEMEDHAKAYETSINEQLRIILHIPHTQIFKKSWWKTEWISDVDFELIFDGIRHTTNDNKNLEKICANYKRCPKKIVALLTNPAIYEDKELFAEELSACSTAVEYDQWLKNIGVWDESKSENWHQRHLMGGSFKDYDAETRITLLNDFITNHRNSLISCSNMKRYQTSVQDRLKYLEPKFFKYLELKKVKEAGAENESDSVPKPADAKKNKVGRPTRTCYLKFDVDTFEKEYIDAWQSVESTPDTANALAVLLNFIRRHSSNLEKLDNSIFFSQCVENETVDGRILVGLQNETGNPVYTPPAPIFPPYMPRMAVLDNAIFTEVPQLEKASSKQQQKKLEANKAASKK